MSTATPSFCVLVVEDEGLVALLIEDMLADLGHTVGAVASRVDQALRLAESGPFDCAILDVNVDGKPSFPIADVLSARGVPYIFATGYGRKGLDPRYASVPILAKPFLRADLERVLSRIAAKG